MELGGGVGANIIVPKKGIHNNIHPLPIFDRLIAAGELDERRDFISARRSPCESGEIDSGFHLDEGDNPLPTDPRCHVGGGTPDWEKNLIIGGHRRVVETTSRGVMEVDDFLAGGVEQLPTICLKDL